MKEKYLSHDNYFRLFLALISATAMRAKSLETRKENAVSFEKYSVTLSRFSFRGEIIRIIRLRNMTE